MVDKQVEFTHSQFEKLGYRCLETCEVKELNGIYYLLQHKSSQAKVVAISNDDTENYFSLNFNTRPSTSNGVAHVLEHLVLCGSKKFPVKDPFFAMMKRSLASFMNAMTGSDATFFPCGSLVKKDFYNLLEVYCDSVFQPLLGTYSFQQEACRLVLDKRKKPMFKGVVLNEMKGLQSDSDHRFFELIYHNLLPDTPYAVSSGGEPSEIPDLTVERLKEFYHTFYHPSRCLFYFYGNFSLVEHLKFINQHVLESVTPLEPLPPMPIVKRFAVPKKVVEAYPYSTSGSLKKKNYVAIAWGLTKTADIDKAICFHVLYRLLFGSDGAVLSRVLWSLNIAAEVLHSLDAEMNEAVLVIGLKDCTLENVPKFEQTVFTELKTLVEKGIDRESIEGALSALEFSMAEKTSHLGLNLLFRSVEMFFCGGNLPDAIAPLAQLRQLKQKCLQPGFLESMIKEYLLDNPHRIHFSMLPDRKLSRRWLLDEKKKAFDMYTALSAQEKKEVAKRESALMKYHQQDDTLANIDKLPKLNLSDVERDITKIALSKQTIQNIPYYFHEVHTNEILYVDLIFDVQHIPFPLASYLPIFGELLTEVGVIGENSDHFLELLAAKTGGLEGEVKAFSLASDPDHILTRFVLSFKAMTEKIDEALSLLGKILTSADFSNDKRIKTLLERLLSETESTIQSNTSHYAANIAGKFFNNYLYYRYVWDGFGLYEFLKKILSQPDAISQIKQAMQELMGLVFSKNNLEVVLSGSLEDEKRLRKPLVETIEKMQKSLKTLPIVLKNPYVDQAPASLLSFHLDIPVSCTSRVMKSVSYDHPDVPALNVLCQILTVDYLHPIVRDQRGAYGCTVSNLGFSGAIVFRSYNDPNIKQTFEVYNGCYQYILDNLTEKQVEEGVLQTISVMDSPHNPGSKGIIAYFRQLQQVTDSLRLKFRNKLFELSVDELKKVAERYFHPHCNKVDVVVASSDMLEAEDIRDYLIMLDSAKLTKNSKKKKKLIENCEETDEPENE